VAYKIQCKRLTLRARRFAPLSPPLSASPPRLLVATNLNHRRLDPMSTMYRSGCTATRTVAWDERSTRFLSSVTLRPPLMGRMLGGSWTPLLLCSEGNRGRRGCRFRGYLWSMLGRERRCSGRESLSRRDRAPWTWHRNGGLWDRRGIRGRRNGGEGEGGGGGGVGSSRRRNRNR